MDHGFNYESLIAFTSDNLSSNGIPYFINRGMLNTQYGKFGMTKMTSYNPYGDCLIYVDTDSLHYEYI